MASPLGDPGKEVIGKERSNVVQPVSVQGRETTQSQSSENLEGGHSNNRPEQNVSDDDWTEEVSHVIEDSIVIPSKEAIHNFFYPQVRNNSARPETEVSPPSNENVHGIFDEHFREQAEKDRQFVEHFWTTFDDILILSIFTQIGIVFRLAASTMFEFFDNVFSNDSALFVNLPLNCLSCFLMGLLCSGERLMEIIATRFTPPRLQATLQSQLPDSDDELDEEMSIEASPSAESWPSRGSFHSELRSGSGIVRKRRRKKARRKKRDIDSTFFRSWEPPLRLNDELRDVQLLALERRIRASKCLLLFPIKKEDVDVMEHYFQSGYKRRGSEGSDHFDNLAGERNNLDFDLALEEEKSDEGENHERACATTPKKQPPQRSIKVEDPKSPTSPLSETSAGGSPRKQPNKESLNDNIEVPKRSNSLESATITSNPETEAVALHDSNGHIGVEEIIHGVTANVTEKVYQLRRANLADGWDVGTTPEAMSDDLMLGLRDGFCGALSSFSSWNSAMVRLMRKGNIGEALVGYMLGLQLPIIAYRFGQHVALYIFIWRCRRETKRDERRGYGIRLSTNEAEDGEECGADMEGNDALSPDSEHSAVGLHHEQSPNDRALPSVRAVITAVFIMSLVTQVTSFSFYSDPKNQLLAMSLLFSPLGVFARWRLSKLNSWRPSFPIGTFTANMVACALNGGLGTIIAGNPGPRERMVLISIIDGFGGTMSSLAALVVEILAGVDPILFRYDGMVYAVISLFCAMVIGFIFSASADWADDTGSS